MVSIVEILLACVLVISIVLVGLAISNRVVFKMSARNITRRKAQTFIVIGGLMIGTAIISSSLVVGDTMSYIFEDQTYRSLGEVDEVIYGENSYGGLAFFNEEMYEEISANLTGLEKLDGVVPVLQEQCSVFDITTELTEPRMTIIALDSELLRDTAFGDLDGNGYFPDMLGAGEIALNSRAAEALDAGIGDRVLVSYGAQNQTVPFSFDYLKTEMTITEIISETGLYGKANYQQRPTMFLELDTAQEMFRRPGQVNLVWVSNRGNHATGEDVTKDVNGTIQAIVDDVLVTWQAGLDAKMSDGNQSTINVSAAPGISPDMATGIPELGVENVKLNSLKSAREGGEAIGDIFLVFSVFAIIAGMVLIVNIFVMLADERKSEMGMARAVGMKRKHLVKMFLFEGSMYSYAAAAIGSFLGLALGRIVIYAFGVIFITESGGFDVPFYFEWESVALAFAFGLLLTFATVFISSGMASKLNIIRAIRGIPEPKGERAGIKTVLGGVLFLALGGLITFLAIGSGDGTSWMAGPSIIALGLALVSYRWLNIRTAFTASSLGIILWILNPVEIPFLKDANFDALQVFIVSGMLLVLAGVFLVMFNSGWLLTGIQKIFGRKGNRAVLKIAVSYPMSNKFRTGMTLGMFSLIITTVTVIALITSMQASSIDNFILQEGGGYDIIGYTNPATPFDETDIENLPDEVTDAGVNSLEMLSVATAAIDYERKDVTPDSMGGFVEVLPKKERYTLFGASDEFFHTNQYTLEEWDTESYATERDAWEAVISDKNLAILDSSRIDIGETNGPNMGDLGGVQIGDEIVLSGLDGHSGNRTVTVVGVMHQSFFLTGLFLQKDVVTEEFGGTEQIMLMNLAPGADVDGAAKTLEREYLANGLEAVDIGTLIEDVMVISTNIMYLMQGFLGIGLLVGIAGLGIIAYRSVIERRQEIGMMRAIGFQKGMVLKSFLIENSFVAILGIVIGIAMGTAIGYQVFTEEFKEMGASFVIPWANLAIIALISYGATLLFTVRPGLRASRIPPAEALRYSE